MPPVWLLSAVLVTSLNAPVGAVRRDIPPGLITPAGTVALVLLPPESTPVDNNALAPVLGYLTDELTPLAHRVVVYSSFSDATAAHPDAVVVARMVLSPDAQPAACDLLIDVLDSGGLPRVRFRLLKAVVLPSSPIPAASTPAAAGYSVDSRELTLSVGRLTLGPVCRAARTVVFSTLSSEGDGGGPAFHALWSSSRHQVADALRRTHPGMEVIESDVIATRRQESFLQGIARQQRARCFVLVDIQRGAAGVAMVLRAFRDATELDHDQLTLTASAGDISDVDTRLFRRALLLERAVYATPRKGMVWADGSRVDMEQFQKTNRDPALADALARSDRNTNIGNALCALGVFATLASCVTGAAAGVALLVAAFVLATPVASLGLAAAGVSIFQVLGCCGCCGFFGNALWCRSIFSTALDYNTLLRVVQKHNRTVAHRVGVAPGDVDSKLLGEDEDLYE